jgi:hypothetical protein
MVKETPMADVSPELLVTPEMLKAANAAVEHNNAQGKYDGKSMFPAIYLAMRALDPALTHKPAVSEEAVRIRQALLSDLSYLASRVGFLTFKRHDDEEVIDIAMVAELARAAIAALTTETPHD